jgi:3-oxoacyl-[acyl-carrier protein] reductase
MGAHMMPGRTVVITGGSRGIGFATARAFLEQRAHVVICGRDARHLDEAADRLGQLGEVTAIRADVRDYPQVRALAETVLKRHGAIDVLVNNAGRAWVGPFVEQDSTSIDDEIDVNLRGVLYVTRVMLPPMLERRRGVIVNVASGAGKTGFAELATYCASKFGVIGFTESVAAEVEDAGVRVYAVCPGAVATDMLKGLYGSASGGMPPERVAAQILRLAERAPIAPGECLQVF